MKARCIFTGGRNRWLSGHPYTIFGWGIFPIYGSGPIKDEIVTVVDSHWSEGEKWYAFMEWPGHWYVASEFVLFDEKEKFEEVTFEEIKQNTPASRN